MSIHAISWTCHRPDGLIQVTLERAEVESHIMCIVKPSAIDFDNHDENKGIVYDPRLLE